MPRARHRRRNPNSEKDSCCMEMFLFYFFFYTMFTMWTNECSWYFNQYCFSAYTFMTIIRRYQSAVLDEIEDNVLHQIIMMAVLMPLFIVHTIVGGIEFFKADLMLCRTAYQGEVFYIIIFMFAVSMCFVFVLLLLCVLMPTWIKNSNRRRRTAGLGNRI